MRTGFYVLILWSSALFGQSATPTSTAPTAAKVFDSQLRGPEGETVSLVEAVPESAFSFVPKNGAFEKSRSFAQQAKHLAAVNYIVAAALLGEKVPAEAGEGESGPASVTSKEQIVKYVKDSFAYCHKAMATLTNANLMEMVPDAFDPKRKSARVSLANIISWHTFDHYGQMAIYARMNNVVPPASR